MGHNTDRIRRMNTRTLGREHALQLVYSWEINRYQDDGYLLTDDVADDVEVVAFSRSLFAGLGAERTAVDAEVDKRLDNWTIHRLAVVDRAILRLGTYEIIYNRDTPPKVALNEYIELAKRYGSEAKTAKLVNGVLDRIARDHRPGEVTQRIEKPKPLDLPGLDPA